MGEEVRPAHARKLSPGSEAGHRQAEGGRRAGWNHARNCTVSRRDCDRLPSQGKAFEDVQALHLAGGHSKWTELGTRRAKEAWQDYSSLVMRPVHRSVPLLREEVAAQGANSWASADPDIGFRTGFGSRGQVDLIDLQANADGEFKFLLNYQDNGIQIYDNRSLTSKRGTAIAFALLDIFTCVGVPPILQVDNGRTDSLGPLLKGVLSMKTLLSSKGGVLSTPKHAKIPIGPLGPGRNPVVNNHISSFGRLFLSTEHIFLRHSAKTFFVQSRSRVSLRDPGT